MKTRYTLLIIILLLSIYQSPAFVFADIMWEQEDAVEESGETDRFRQVIYLSGKRFAIRTEAGVKIILDISSDSITTMDENEKTYFTMSLSELEEMQDRLRSNTDTLIEDALKNIPEDQRDEYRIELEKKLKALDENIDSGHTAKSYKKTGDTSSIIGYKTEVFRSTKISGDYHEIWCSRDIDISELKNLLTSAGKSKLMKNIGKNYTALDLGFPLKSVTKIDDATITSTVTSLSFETIDSSVFSIPGDYIKRTSSAMP